MFAKTRLQVLVLPERPQHESYAFGVGAREQQYAVADDAVAQQRWGIVEEHQVEPIARNLAPECASQTPDRVLGRGRVRRVLGVEQHRDVDVALAPRPAARPASVQPGETHRGLAAQGTGKTIAEPSNLSVVGVRGHVVSRSIALPVPRRDRGEPRIGAARSGRKGLAAVNPPTSRAGSATASGPARPRPSVSGDPACRAGPSSRGSDLRAGDRSPSPAS